MIQDGIYFYWLSWLLWGVVTFFFPKGRQRTFIALFLLANIIFSLIEINVDSVQILASMFWLYTIMIGYFVMSGRSVYKLSASLVIAIGYSGLLLWIEVYSIALFVPKIIMIGIAIILLTNMFARRLIDQLAICICGMTIGQFMYDFILWGYGLTADFGGLSFLDDLFIIINLLIIVYVADVLFNRTKLILASLKKEFE